MKPLSFMEEEQNEQIQEEEDLDFSEVAEGEEDSTDWKELALKQQGINKRLKTKMEKLKEEKENPPEKPEIKKEEKESSDFKFNSGDKALLKSYKDIQGADELALAENWIKKYKCEIDEMLDDEVFNTKLTKLREEKAVKSAVPTGNKRSVGTDTTSVDYWLGKYESGESLNSVPQEFRSQVLNARLEKEESKRMFG